MGEGCFKDCHGKLAIHEADQPQRVRTSELSKIQILTAAPITIGVTTSSFGDCFLVWPPLTPLPSHAAAQPALGTAPAPHLLGGGLLSRRPVGNPAEPRRLGSTDPSLSLHSHTAGAFSPASHMEQQAPAATPARPVPVLRGANQPIGSLL